jgi:hypothetical protein
MIIGIPPLIMFPGKAPGSFTRYTMAAAMSTGNPFRHDGIEYLNLIAPFPVTGEIVIAFPRHGWNTSRHIAGARPIHDKRFITPGAERQLPGPRRFHYPCKRMPIPGLRALHDAKEQGTVLHERRVRVPRWEAR